MDRAPELSRRRHLKPEHCKLTRSQVRFPEIVSNSVESKQQSKPSARKTSTPQSYLHPAFVEVGAAKAFKPIFDDKSKDPDYS